MNQQFTTTTIKKQIDPLEEIAKLVKRATISQLVHHSTEQEDGLVAEINKNHKGRGKRRAHFVIFHL